MINYNSALKVVNLGEPEASLISAQTTKPPRSGRRRSLQPHRLDPRRRPAVGKHRAPRLIERSSTGSAKPRASAAEQAGAENAAPPTAMHRATSRPRPVTATCRRSGTPSSSARRPDIPTSSSSTSGSPHDVEGLLYVPRQDISNGRVKDFEIRTSPDAKTWRCATRLRPLGQRCLLQSTSPSPAPPPATSSFAA